MQSLILNSIKNLIFFLSVLLIAGACNQTPNTTKVAEEPEVIDSFVQLSFLFVGDIMGHGPQINAALDPETGEYDYRPNYQYVSPIIQSADLAVANLEVTLPGKPPYAGYPQFKSPDALAYALKDAGFDIIVTANNHSNDGYGSALLHTLDVLGGLDFHHTGTFRNMEERDSLYPLIIEENDLKIALLNYTYGTNGIPDTPPTHVNLIDTAIIRADIAKAHEANPDLIITYMHWGDEYKLIENQRQRNQAQFMADLGVDLIIGGHPHVIQPIRYISSSPTDSVLCVFSLGNYISNQRRKNTDGGLMFEIAYEKNIFTHEIRILDYWHHLVWRYRAPHSEEHPNRQYFVIPIAHYEAGLLEGLELSEADHNLLTDFAERMRKHLKENAVSKEKLPEPKTPIEI